MSNFLNEIFSFKELIFGKSSDRKPALNDDGGYEYTGKDEKKADACGLITLPSDVKGTNCSNCIFFKDNFCDNKSLLLPVTKKMCCSYWDKKTIGSAIDNIDRANFFPNKEKSTATKNDLGGFDYKGDELNKAKKADLITLPKNVSGTNCSASNCTMYATTRDGKLFCKHPKIMLPVTDRMSCGWWDNNDVKRDWNKVVENKFMEGGVINESNYFENSEGYFYIIPKSEYDSIDTKEYVSAFGSRYKVKDGILYRAADHWGVMNSVKWDLKNKDEIKNLYTKELDKGLQGYSQFIYAKIPFSEMKLIGKQLIVVEPVIRELIQQLNKNGHQALIIGGAVRDALLGIQPKDIDVEVYKISYSDLSDFLSKYGRVDLVGKSFGVIKFHPKGGEMSYDFSVPRKENKIGIEHTSFAVTFDKNMTIAEAGARRDFTFNAIAYDPIENKIYDYFGGVKDLENKVIRHTSSAFREDSLRILRAMQFQARFDFSIHPDTINEIRNMLKTNDYDTLSKERIYEEFSKWAAKGIRHDLIFKFMRDTNLIERYPELKLLKETPQDVIYHPEGDVEIHTEMTLREMDKIIEREGIVGDEKIILVMSIFLHDIAKPPTTKEMLKKDSSGVERIVITSHGHEAMGGEMVKEFLPRLGFHESLIAPISNLVANHLAGVSISMITSKSGQMKAVKKLSRRLFPATIKQLLYVMEADSFGRGGERRQPSGNEILRELSAEADVQTKAYQPILMGRHLIEKGLKPSVKFKEILDKAFEAQESGVFNDLEGGKVWLDEYLKNQ